MKQLKQFFKALEKQGLITATASHGEKEYRFTKSDGFQVIQPKKPDASTEAPHQKGEIIEIDFKEGAVPEIKSGRSKQPPKRASWDQKRRREIRLLSRVVYVMAAVAMVLLVVIAYTGRKANRDESQPTVLTDKNGWGESPDIVDKESPRDIGSQDEKEDLQSEVEEKPVVPSGAFEGEKKTVAGSESVVESRTGPVESERPKNNTTPPDGPVSYRESVSILDISETLSRGYNRNVEIIRMELPRKVEVRGYVNITLFINKKGRVNLFKINDNALDVSPHSKKERVVLKLKTAISELRFKQPRDKHGRPVNVEDWRLNFQVTQFKRRMILRKRL